MNTFGEWTGQDGPVMCECCGELPAVVHLTHAGLCDDCSVIALREELEPILGYRPCSVIVWRGEQPCICLVESGTPHEH